MRANIRIITITSGLLLIFTSQAFCFWIWSPKTKKVSHPSHTVKNNPEAQLSFGIDLYNNGNTNGALREFRNLLRSYPKAKEAAEAQYYLGRVYEDLGKPYEAYKNYQKVVDKYPFSERIDEIVEIEYNIAEKFLESFLNKKSSVIWQEIAGREYTPVEILRSVVDNDPYGKYGPVSQYKIGVFLREIGQFSAAIVELQKVIDEHPQSEWAEAARYQIALSQADRSLKPDYDQETTRDAIQEFQDFVDEHPELDLAVDAEDQIVRLQEKEIESSFRVAEFYEKRRQFKAAKIYYQDIVDSFPRSPWASKALERLEVLRKGER